MQGQLTQRRKLMNNSTGILLLILSLFFLLIYTGCGTTVIQEKLPEHLKDGKYDGESPYADASDTFDKVGKSVSRINSTAFYATYSFPPDAGVTVYNVERYIRMNNLEPVYYDYTSTGTATIIYTTPYQIVLLTSAHVVSYDDTLKTYYIKSDSTTGFLETISYLHRIDYYGFGIEEGSRLDLLAMDELTDLAILGKEFESRPVQEYQSLPLKSGNTGRLRLGSLLYHFGYPMQFQMLTRGIVGALDIKERGIFITDAVITRGFSGAPVFAVLDGVPHFEWVGIVSSLHADYKDIIVPKQLPGEPEYPVNSSYSGELHITRQAFPKYGMTRITPIETILDFIESNIEKLKANGYDLRSYIRKARSEHKSSPPSAITDSTSMQKQ